MGQYTIEFRSRKNGASNADGGDKFAFCRTRTLSSESQEGLPSCLNMKMHFEIMMIRCLNFWIYTHVNIYETNGGEHHHTANQFQEEAQSVILNNSP